MKIRYVFLSLIVVGLICCSIGLCLGHEIEKNFFCGSGFYDITLLQIIDLLVKIILGISVAFLISKKVNYLLRKKELMISCVSEYEKQIVLPYDLFLSLSIKPSSAKQRDVLAAFRRASNALEVFRELTVDISEPQLKSMAKDCYTDFLRLKTAITDTPAGLTKDVHPGDVKIQNVEKAFGEAKKGILKCKLQIYE